VADFDNGWLEAFPASAHFPCTPVAGIPRIPRDIDNKEKQQG